MVENGLIYEVREGNNYKEKILKCYENELIFNVDTELIETSRIITGEIYKKHHENGVVELTNDVELILQGYDNIIELLPNGGMVDINLEIPIEITSISIKEKGVQNVNGIYKFWGAYN